MESKTEEKVRYYFRNISDNPNVMDFCLNICEFEDLLKNYLENNTDVLPVKNGYKLYGIDNKFFKIYQDGSCFGYTIKEQNMKKIDDFYQYYILQSQIFNDDFPGLKVYWVEEIYEEIIFKYDDLNLIFSKSIDVPRDKIDYSIFIEPKNSSVNMENVKKIFAKLKIISS